MNTFEVLRRWSLLIFAIGLGMITNEAAGAGSLATTVGGIALALIGAGLLVYRRYHHLGWIAAAFGAGMILLGAPFGESQLFGRAIETPNTALMLTGLAVVLAGLGAFAYFGFVRTRKA